jgi:hypothetical protein
MPGRGQRPRQPARTPPACSASPKSPLAPPPSPPPLATAHHLECFPLASRHPRSAFCLPPACPSMRTAPEDHLHRPRRRHALRLFCPCSLRNHPPNRLLLSPRSQPNLTRQASAVSTDTADPVGFGMPW